MDIIRFYRRYFKTLGIHVDSNGGLFFKLYNDLLPISINGLPAYLPTDENIKTSVELIDGKPTPVKFIFNPLKEDAIKTNNPAFNKLKQIAELRAVRSIYVIGEVLFTIMQQGVDVKDIELNRLIALIENYNKGRVKKIVDENTLTNWIALYEEILEKHNEYFYTKLNFKRGGTIDGVKYTRIGTIVFPFSEKLNEYNPKKETFLGIKLRNKDVHTYMTMLNYLFDNDAITPKQFPTDNKTSPNNIALIKMFDYIKNSVNKLINGLKEIESVDEEDIEAIFIPDFEFDVDNIDNIIDSLKTEINNIPSDMNPTIKENENKPSTQQSVNEHPQPMVNSVDPWSGPAIPPGGSNITYPTPPQPMMNNVDPWGGPAIPPGGSNVTYPMGSPMTPPITGPAPTGVTPPTKPNIGQPIITNMDPWGM